MSIKDSALDYCRLGWSVIPIHPGKKRPLVRWQAYQYRPADVFVVEEWFESWPDANIAVVTVIVSWLIVLDVDPAHGGATSLKQIEQENGTLPATVEASTGGGGRHLYFAHPGEIKRNRVGIAPDIDLRGDGGYVVAPPSRHASGHRYRWAPSRSPWETDLASIPVWLLRTAARTTPRGHPIDHWRCLLPKSLTQGERNDTIASLSGHLLWHGVNPGMVAELLLCWNAERCLPPLEPEEVLRTIESITRLHERHGDGHG